MILRRAGMGLRAHSLNSHPLRNPICIKQQIRIPFARQYSPYPKEGVFQPNSPPRQPGPPSFSPQQHVPQQPEYYPQQQYSQQGPPPPPPNQGLDAVVRRMWRITRPFLIYVVGASLILYGYETMCTLSAEYIQEPIKPGTPEDRLELEALGEEFDALPFVQQLRAMEIVKDDGEVVTAWEEWTAYEGFTDGHRREYRLTTGPLKGSQGVAAQRVFYDDKADVPHMMLFINFGRGTCGWPNVVHGGAIATLCDEALGRFAILSTVEKSAVTASLEINYHQPCRPGEWYVFHVTIDPTQKSTDRKKYVRADLFCVGEQGPIIDENKVHGTNVLQIENCHQHVSTKALFIVPKGVQLQPLPSTF